MNPVSLQETLKSALAQWDVAQALEACRQGALVNASAPSLCALSVWLGYRRSSLAETSDPERMRITLDAIESALLREGPRPPLEVWLQVIDDLFHEIGSEQVPESQGLARLQAWLAADVPWQALGYPHDGQVYRGEDAWDKVTSKTIEWSDPDFPSCLEALLGRLTVGLLQQGLPLKRVRELIEDVPEMEDVVMPRVRAWQRERRLVKLSEPVGNPRKRWRG